MKPEHWGLILVTQVTAERGVASIRQQKDISNIELQAGLLLLDHGVIAGGKEREPSEMEELALLTKAGYLPAGEFTPSSFPLRGIGWAVPSLADRIVLWRHKNGWLHVVQSIGGNAPGYLIAAVAGRRLLALGATPDPLMVSKETEKLLANPNLPPPKRVTASYLKKLFSSFEGRADV